MVAAEQAMKLSVLLKQADASQRAEILRNKIRTVQIRNERIATNPYGPNRKVHVQIFPAGKHEWHKLYHTDADLKICEVMGEAHTCMSCGQRTADGECGAQPQRIRDQELLEFLDNTDWEIKYDPDVAKKGRLRFYIQVQAKPTAPQPRKKQFKIKVIAVNKGKRIAEGQLAFADFLTPTKMEGCTC